MIYVLESNIKRLYHNLDLTYPDMQNFMDPIKQ